MRTLKDAKDTTPSGGGGRAGYGRQRGKDVLQSCGTYDNKDQLRQDEQHKFLCGQGGGEDGGGWVVVRDIMIHKCHLHGFQILRYDHGFMPH